MTNLKDNKKINRKVLAILICSIILASAFTYQIFYYGNELNEIQSGDNNILFDSQPLKLSNTDTKLSKVYAKTFDMPVISINPHDIKIGVQQPTILTANIENGTAPFELSWAINGTIVKDFIETDFYSASFPSNNSMLFEFLNPCDFVTLLVTVTDSNGLFAYDSTFIFDPFVARTIHLQDIPVSADFIIRGSGGYFWSTYSDGSIYENNTVKLDVVQGAIDYLNTTLGEGIVWLQNLDIPSGLTMKQGVLVLEIDEGVINFHGDFGHTPYQSQDMPVMVFHNYLNTSKAYIEWRNSDNEKIAWVTAHEYLNDTLHKHFSIETVQSDMSTAVTRFQITYGVDTAKVQIVNSNFEVSDTGLIFMSDTNTKIWRNAEDDLRLTVGGSTRVQIQNTTTTITNDLVANGGIYYNGELPHINRLSGVTPTASSWDTDPTDLAYSTDGDWDVGTGIGADLNVGGYGAGGALTWDMGANYTVTVHGLITIGNNLSQNVRTRIYTSFDNSNWYESIETAHIYASISATNETWTISTTAYTRYIKISWDNGSSGADIFGAVTEIEAIDLNW